MTRRDRGFGVRPCPVRWQPWQRVEVRFVVLECEQPCDEREHEHRGEPILSNDGAYNQKHTVFLHRRALKYAYQVEIVPTQAGASKFRQKVLEVIRKNE